MTATGAKSTYLSGFILSFYSLSLFNPFPPDAMHGTNKYIYVRLKTLHVLSGIQKIMNNNSNILFLQVLIVYSLADRPIFNTVTCNHLLQLLLQSLVHARVI